MTLLETLRTMRSKAPQKPADFILRYTTPGGSTITVGHLSFDGTAWTFRYDDEFKDRGDLHPIEGLEDVDEVYRSPYLFPFFAIRIPDTSREDVRQALAEQHIRRVDTSDLLRLFGRRVASSPAFELVPA